MLHLLADLLCILLQQAGLLPNCAAKASNAKTFDVAVEFA